MGSIAGVEIVDDYAHHPTEVQATIQAARKGWPDRRIVSVFQPHLYSRTLLLHRELGRELELRTEEPVIDGADLDPQPPACHATFG